MGQEQRQYMSFETRDGTRICVPESSVGLITSGEGGIKVWLSRHVSFDDNLTGPEVYRAVAVPEHGSYDFHRLGLTNTLLDSIHRGEAE